jgi:hypothetical protein
MNDSSPTLVGMAKSFLESAAKFAASGFRVTPIDKLTERLAICQACEHLKPEGFGGTGQCGVCGCSIKAKTRMATTDCPAGKWGPVQG